jgi:hypothetical protein
MRDRTDNNPELLTSFNLLIFPYQIALSKRQAATDYCNKLWQAVGSAKIVYTEIAIGLAAV